MARIIGADEVGVGLGVALVLLPIYATPAHQADVSIALTNAFVYPMPARSLTVLVLKP